MSGAHVPDGSVPGYFGVYPAQVTKLTGDPEQLSRVQVKFPFLGTDGEREVRAWARLCSPYAGADQGLEILPEVGSEVVVAFHAGQLQCPYIIGATWNGRSKPPHPAEQANNIRMFKSRAGTVLEFDDTAGAPKVKLTTASGHRLELNDASSEVVLQHANGNVVKINATGDIEITASKSVAVKAPKVTVDAVTSNFTGIVTCTTLKASVAISSPVYSQGIGNFW